jgi:hypothetical protein
MIIEYYTQQEDFTKRRWRLLCITPSATGGRKTLSPAQAPPARRRLCLRRVKSKPPGLQQSTGNCFSINKALLCSISGDMLLARQRQSLCRAGHNMLVENTSSHPSPRPVRDGMWVEKRKWYPVSGNTFRPGRDGWKNCTGYFVFYQHIVPAAQRLHFFPNTTGQRPVETGMYQQPAQKGRKPVIDSMLSLSGGILLSRLRAGWFCAWGADAVRRLSWITPSKPKAQLGAWTALPYLNCEAVQLATGLRRGKAPSIPSCAVSANVPENSFTLAATPETSRRIHSRLRRQRKRPGEFIHACGVVGNVPANRFTLAASPETSRRTDSRLRRRRKRPGEQFHVCGVAANTTGYQNTATGSQALRNNTTVIDDTAAFRATFSF